MDVDREALFSQPLMGHPVFTVFMNWTLARAGNTQRLKQLGGEDVLGNGHIQHQAASNQGQEDLEARGRVGRDRER